MYNYSFDKHDYKNDVKEFEKIMTIFNLGNYIKFNNIDISVTYVEMRSIVGGGKYYQLLNEYFKIFEWQNLDEIMFKNTHTFQKLMNHIKFAILKYKQNNQDYRVFNIVYYECKNSF